MEKANNSGDILDFAPSSQRVGAVIGDSLETFIVSSHLLVVYPCLSTTSFAQNGGLLSGIYI